MANWKIQDIAPPKTAEKKVEEPPEVVPIKRVKRKKVRLPGWLAKGVLPLLILSAVLVGSVHVFFAKADVALWPEVRQVKLLEPIVAEVGREKLNKEERIIPAHTLTEEKKATRLFPASSSTIKENRASGTIRVFNAYTTTPQNLLVQTRFVSEEGKLFRTPAKITIPGKTQEQGKMVPGFVDIEVIAAEAGEDYNIEPGNFSLPGLSGSALFTVIYGESTEPMTGGSERTVSVVSENDIEKAKNSLIEELTDKIVEDLGVHPETAHRFLRRMSERDSDDNIIGIMGLSLNDRWDNKFSVNGKTLNTWSAWDSMFLPALLQQTATIESRSPVTLDNLKIIVGPQGVVRAEPAGMAVTMVAFDPQDHDTGDLSASWGDLCRRVHFFANRSEAARWAKG
ncbi:hypothetical protein IIC44_02505, partial [Patescibacteria group bacterium]|nr:hypothetical protein [Patescibacteria group bacterium]